MNYSLGFPDPSRELSISPKQSLEAVVSYFRSKHLEADSAVRAIHHQPAAEGIFAEIPALVDTKLRTALEKRGITRLYSHQADAFDQIQAGKQRGQRDTGDDANPNPDTWDVRHGTLSR